MALPRSNSRELRVPLAAMVLAVLLGGLAGAAWDTRTHARYEATCVLDYGIDPASSTDARSSDDWYRTQDLVLGSEAVAERVIQELRLDHDAAFVLPEQGRDPDSRRRIALRNLRGRLSIAPVPDTHAVRITAHDTSPTRAARIANAIADAYMSKAADDRMAANQRALAWLGEQIGNTSRQLAEAEIKIQRHLEQGEGSNVGLKEREALLIDEIQRLTQARIEAQLSRIELVARLAKLKSAAQTENPFEARTIELDSNDDVRHLRSSYLSVWLDQEEPPAEGAESTQFRFGQKKMDALWERMQRTLDSIVRSTQAELTAVQQMETQLQKAIAMASSSSRALELQQIEYARLERERTQAEEWLKALRDRSSAIGIAAAAGLVNARVIDRASPTPSPLASRIGSGATLGAMGGFLTMGLTLVVVSQRQRRRKESMSSSALASGRDSEVTSKSPEQTRAA